MLTRSNQWLCIGGGLILGWLSIPAARWLCLLITRLHTISWTLICITKINYYYFSRGLEETWQDRHATLKNYSSTVHWKLTFFYWLNQKISPRVKPYPKSQMKEIENYSTSSRRIIKGYLCTFPFIEWPPAKDVQ